MSLLNPNAVFEHQFGEPLAVDEHRAGFDALGVLNRPDKKRLVVMNNPRFALNHAARRRILGCRAVDAVVLAVALDLDVHPLEPERILTDAAVDAAIARPTQSGRALFGAAVTYCDEQVNHCLFEEAQTLFAKALQLIG